MFFFFGELNYWVMLGKIFGEISFPRYSVDSVTGIMAVSSLGVIFAVDYRERYFPFIF